MGRAGRELDAYYRRGMLEIRPTLHLTLRLALRANQVLHVSGSAAEGAGFWRVALPAFVVLDVAVWFALRRSDRFGLAWRLPLDALDAAFWAMSPLPAGGSYEWAFLVAIPLGLEAGVRIGWRGLVVPAVILLTTGVGAVLTDKPLSFVGVGWVVLTVAMGLAFFRYCRHLDQRAGAQRLGVLAAARRRAHLAGQNRVAMGASSAVDVLEGLVPVLGRPAEGSALWRLADGWKSQLSASTAREARYLQVALLEWETLHNRHPDLSGLVQVRVGEGEGTTLLSATQVGQLRRALDQLDPRGAVAVRLCDPDASRLPGQALQLDIGGRRVTVPADRWAAPPAIDPCAVTYMYMASLAVVAALPAFGRLPVPAVVAGVSTCAVVGVVSHRRIVSVGKPARLQVFLLAVAAATALTLLNGFARSPLNPDGEPIVPFGIGLLLLSFLGGFYWRSLGRWRWLMPGAVAGNVVIGVLVFPFPAAITARALAASVLWNLFPYFVCRHLAAALERAGAQHAVSIQTVDEEAERAAFRDGRESVVGLVRQAREDALRQLELLGPQLDARVAELAGHRLEEVDLRLRTIESARESSSSTTTS